ncbi:hypothetical protein CRUP_034457 [Coryphaenoides rupestris]|nr:hypothetical protein CRUP_034457 [Coryphaenoides rupestris]
MGLLIASIFLGMMVGGYLWGYLADQRGRQRVLVVSLSVNGLFGALASLAPWFWLFLLLRFVSGVGVGGSIPVIFSYFSEFLPRLRRGAMISALATFWMAGNILAAGLAWLVIPASWAHFTLGPLTMQSWRVFVVLCSIPSLSSALLFSLMMPESPKFLMEMFGLVTSSQTYRADSLSSHESRLCRLFKTGLAPITQLFSGPLMARSAVLLVVFYTISFGYYGLWMWFPELFKRTQEGGSPCANVTRPAHLQDLSCYPVNTVACSLLASSVSVFFIYVVQTKTGSLVLSCLFSGVSVISWNSLDVVGTELYPTQLRSSALGFFTGVGRVAAIMGNIVFGSLVDSTCAVPILLVSALLLAGGVVACLLPQTKQTEIN